MRNRAPLTVAGIIFLIVGCVQLLRYYFKVPITSGEPYPLIVPVDASLYAGIFALILALWMFISSGRE